MEVEVCQAGVTIELCQDDANQANQFFPQQKVLHYHQSVHGSRVDSIAVSIFTNSETAAATPLRVMQNF